MCTLQYVTLYFLHIRVVYVLPIYLGFIVILLYNFVICC